MNTKLLIALILSSSVALAEAPGRDEYTQLLDFAPQDNKISVEDLVLSYRIKGNEVKLGPRAYKSSDFSLSLENSDENRASLLIAWPQPFLQEGQVSVFDVKAQSIWSKKLQAGDLVADVNLKDKNRNIDEYAIVKFRIQFGKTLPVASWADKILKICAQDEAETHDVQICFPPFRLKVLDGRVRIEWGQAFVKIVEQGDPTQSGMDAARLSLDGSPVQSEGQLVFSESKAKLDTFIQMSNQTQVTVMNKLSGRPILTDVALREDKKTLDIKGTGPRPFRAYEEGHAWRLNARMPLNELYYELPGGLVLTRSVHIPDNPPRHIHRIQFHRDELHTVYAEKVTLQGYVDPKWEAEAPEGRIQKSEQGRFLVELESPDVGQTKTYHISTRDGDHQYLGNFELTRAYAGEAMLRGATVFQNFDNMLFMGDLSAGYFFESLLGWKDYQYSRQRWGLFGEYATYLSGTGPISKAEFINATIETKYQIKHGIWNKEESLGPVLGYQLLSYRRTTAQMLGAGFYWAAPVPEVADKIFNAVSWFRHPKFWGAQLMVYVIPLGESITLRGSSNLTFFTKMFFTEQAFFELGFGIKRWAFTEDAVGTDIAIVSSSGSLGLGLLF